MSEASDAIEMHLMKQADWQINRMIPRGGFDMFGDPESMSVYGLGSFVGAEDLMTKGGSASFGHISAGDLGVAADLTDDGSNAFGYADDLTDGGSDAFGQFLVAAPGERVLPEMEGLGADLMPGVDGMGALGRIAWGRFASKVKSLFRNKKKKAKKVLKKAATEVKKNEGKATELKKRAVKPGVGPVQRDNLIKQAQILEERAKKLRQIAAGAAREAVAPRIRREEAKAIVRPIMKDVAKKVAASGQKTIRKIAKVAKKAPPSIREQIAKRVGREAIKESIAKEMTGGRQKQTSSLMKLMQQKMKDPAYQKMEAQREWLLRRRGIPVGTPEEPMKKSISAWDRFRFGLRGLDTVTNPPETADIVDDWRSDDIYGEPLGL